MNHEEQEQKGEEMELDVLTSKSASLKEMVLLPKVTNISTLEFSSKDKN